MAYCMYLRKSRSDVEAEARGAGETLARHKQQLYSLAKLLKVNITKIYSEVESGETIAGRPVMQELLRDVELGLWEGVLVVELERLARGDTIDQGTVAQSFKYSNTLIITPAKTYHPNDESDEEFFEFGLFMSRREYKTINRRLNNGRMASVMEGKYLGSKPPFGYTRKKLENQKGYTLIPDKEQAEIVKLIYDLYTFKNKGPTLIAKELDKLGLKPQLQDIWSVNTLRSLLQNPVYAGYISWKRRPQSKSMVNGVLTNSRPRNNNYTKVKGLHPAIVDEEIWNKAQEKILAKLCPKTNPRQTIKNPFAGLIKCGVCDSNMIRRPSKKAPDSIICTNRHCNNIGSYLYLVEEDIILAIGEWLRLYKIEIENIEVSKPSGLVNVEKSISRLESEVKTLDLQLDGLYDLLEQKIYTIEIFMERSQKLKTKKEEIIIRLNSLKKDLSLSSDGDPNIIIPNMEKITEVYDTISSAEEKNILLKSAIGSIIYIKSIKGGKNPESQRNYSLQIMPLLPSK